MMDFWKWVQSMLLVTFRDEEGQTMVEYGLVLAFITVVAIGFFQLFGTVSDAFYAIPGF